MNVSQGLVEIDEMLKDVDEHIREIGWENIAEEIREHILSLKRRIELLKERERNNGTAIHTG